MNAADLPKRVLIREEGPRDGWQNIEDVVIPAETKLDFIAALVDTGMPRMTVTSMVRPDWVPQLADADEVLAQLPPSDTCAYGVLVLNSRGLDRLLGARAAGAPVNEVSVACSVSESHNQSNSNMSVDASMTQLEELTGRALDAGLRVSGGLATVFGCSFEGEVSEERVLELSKRLVSFGAQELILGDTTGMANPVQVARLMSRMRDQLPETQLTLHFHNTRGAALANVYAALQVGIDSFESAFGELGGCQFARGATGNLSSEDLVSMLHEMGIETGIDLNKLVAAARGMQEFLGRPLDSHLVTAGPVEWSGSVA